MKTLRNLVGYLLVAAVLAGNVSVVAKPKKNDQGQYMSKQRTCATTGTNKKCHGKGHKGMASSKHGKKGKDNKR